MAPRYVFPILIDVRTVSNLLCVSANTVYVWVRQNLLSSVKLPSGGIRIRLADVAEIVGESEEDLHAWIRKYGADGKRKV